jgi:hypothetical protein
MRIINKLFYLSLITLLWCFSTCFSQSVKTSDSPFVKIDTGFVVNDLGFSQGVAWGDYNNDGYPDLYVSNSWINDNNLFYLNNKNGSFTKITEGIVANDPGNSNGCSWGDFNNDGYLDLYVSNVNNQNNFLYLNKGDNSFEKITQGSIVTDLEWSYGCAWGDYNNDGFLDIYISNYQGQNNSIYRNEKDGTFSKISSDVLPLDNSSSINATWGDLDNDGYLDIFVCNKGVNILYRNINGEYFVKIETGEIVTDNVSSYGSSFADYNNDGFLDIFVANWHVKNCLYKNNGDFTFTKISDCPIVTEDEDSEGSSWGDYNNDGFIDLFVTNDGINSLFKNLNGEDFIKVEDSVLCTTENNSNGTTWTDIDTDGDLDLFIANGGNTKNLFYTNIGNNNNWIKLKLNGNISNRSAIGAKVKILYGDGKMQYQEVSAQSGGGCGAQNDLSRHFGLGENTSIDTLVIKWPSGVLDKYSNLESDSLYYFNETYNFAPSILNPPNLICQNYPNPFTNNTKIIIRLEKPEKVSLSIYNIEGALVNKAFDNEIIGTTRYLLLEGSDFSAPGVYYYELQTESVVIVKKMVFVK